jgi:hypothetical protein
VLRTSAPSSPASGTQVCARAGGRRRRVGGCGRAGGDGWARAGGRAARGGWRAQAHLDERRGRGGAELVPDFAHGPGQLGRERACRPRCGGDVLLLHWTSAGRRSSAPRRTWRPESARERRRNWLWGRRRPAPPRRRPVAVAADPAAAAYLRTFYDTEHVLLDNNNRRQHGRCAKAAAARGAPCRRGAPAGAEAAGGTATASGGTPAYSVPLATDTTRKYTTAWPETTQPAPSRQNSAAGTCRLPQVSVVSLFSKRKKRLCAASSWLARPRT